MPGPFIPIVLGTYILAAASGGLPKIDAQATCQSTENIITGLFGDKTMATVENCMRQENGGARSDPKGLGDLFGRRQGAVRAAQSLYAELRGMAHVFRDVQGRAKIEGRL